MRSCRISFGRGTEREQASGLLPDLPLSLTSAEVQGNVSRIKDEA